MPKIHRKNLRNIFFALMTPYIKWFKLSPDVHQHLTDVMFRMIEYHPNTLVEMSSKAQTADPAMQLQYFVEMADRCIFVAGCFPESLHEQGIEFDWVFNMAKAGYQASARMDPSLLRDRDQHVYLEIANNIIEASWAIRETYIEVQLLNINDVNIIYDFFMRSQSMAAQRKLQQLGFHYTNGDDTEE